MGLRCSEAVGAARGVGFIGGRVGARRGGECFTDAVELHALLAHAGRCCVSTGLGCGVGMYTPLVYTAKHGLPAKTLKPCVYGFSPHEPTL